MTRIRPILAAFLLTAALAAVTSMAPNGAAAQSARSTHVVAVRAPDQGRAFKATAAATIHTICDEGDNYCLNNKGCSIYLGNPVITWYYQTSPACDAFELYGPLNVCNTNPPGMVTETCPFTVGSGDNALMAGYYIYALYAPEVGFCLATTAAGYGEMGVCPNANGSGGSNGVLFVYYDDIFTSTGDMVNRYWTNYFYQHYGFYQQPAVLESQGSAGAQVFLANNDGSGPYTWWFPS